MTYNTARNFLEKTNVLDALI